MLPPQRNRLPMPYSSETDEDIPVACARCARPCMMRCGNTHAPAEQFYVAAADAETTTTTTDLVDARECTTCYALYCSRNCVDYALRVCAACEHVECSTCTTIEQKAPRNLSTYACSVCGAKQ